MEADKLTLQKKSLSRQDENLRNMIELKEVGNRLDWKDMSAKSQALKFYWAQWDSQVIDDGVEKSLQERARMVKKSNIR